jgi:hypothetical protein
MRRLRWIIPAVLLILLALEWVDRRYVSPRQVGEDNILGMSKQQLRSRYGEPNWVVDENNWVYYRGMLGGGTGIGFKDDVVVHYESRAAQ